MNFSLAIGNSGPGHGRELWPHQFFSFTPVQPCDCSAGSLQAHCSWLHLLYVLQPPRDQPGVSHQSISVISVLNEKQSGLRWRWRNSHDANQGAECLRLRSKVKILNSFGAGCCSTSTDINKQYFFRCSEIFDGLYLLSGSFWVMKVSFYSWSPNHWL